MSEYFNAKTSRGNMTCKVLAVVCFLVMLGATPCVAHAAETAVSQQSISWERITVPFTFYITSLVATALFVWKLARSLSTQQLNSLDEKLSELEREVEVLLGRKKDDDDG